MNIIKKSVKSQSKVHNNCGQIVAKFFTVMFAYYTQVIVDKNVHILSTVFWMSGNSTRLCSYCGRFVHNIYQSVV